MSARRVVGAATIATLGVVTAVAAVGSPTAADGTSTTIAPTSTTIAPSTVSCTPGYWKNHEDSWALAGLDSTQLTGDTFGNAVLYGLDDETLLESLSGRGGPDVEDAARILLRAAVASLLNAAVEDPASTAEIVDAVDAALASGNRDEILTVAEELDTLNNEGTCDVGEIAEDEVAVEAQSGPPADVPAGPPADVPDGPPTGIPAGPPADVPVGPPADVPVGPPADVPVGPPADVPVGPPADVPAEVPAR
jgi:hypothetical protein